MSGEDFCFETVMSTERNLNLLRRAKAKGYFIRCFYILTADPEINVWRVQSRVAEGGHDVPREKIISRYEKALKLVKDVVDVSDVCHIYDNSESRHCILLDIGQRDETRTYRGNQGDYNQQLEQRRRNAPVCIAHH